MRKNSVCLDSWLFIVLSTPIEKQMAKLQKCRICKKPTNVVFNISLKATPVCSSCASLITRQQVMAWADEDMERDRLKGEKCGRPSVELPSGNCTLCGEYVGLELETNDES